MAKPFISVVIPAYNESGRLPLTLIDADRHLAEQEYSYEVIVVNDGSTDGTGEIVKRFAPLVRNLKFINNPTNMGKGAALRIGMLAARGNWCVAMDADNAVSIVELTKVMPHLTSDDVDIIVGSRRVRGGRTKPSRPLVKELLERFLNAWARLLLGVNVRDASARFLVLRSEAAHRIFAATRVNRWPVVAEALALGVALRYRIREAPVFVASRAGSHRDATAYLRDLFEVARMRWWLSRGKYQLG